MHGQMEQLIVKMISIQLMFPFFLISPSQNQTPASITCPNVVSLFLDFPPKKHNFAKPVSWRVREAIPNPNPEITMS